ncbi:MAG: hypothetical protein AAF591_18190, partial [Verrucomicrobiota bacterium]
SDLLAGRRRQIVELFVNLESGRYRPLSLFRLGDIFANPVVGLRPRNPNPILPSSSCLLPLKGGQRSRAAARQRCASEPEKMSEH